MRAITPKTSRLASAPLAAIALAAALAFTAPALADDAKPLVTVNGLAITAADIKLAETEIGPQLASVPADERQRVVIEYMIDNMLMAAAARGEDLAKSDGFEDRIAYYRERAMRDAYFDKYVMDEVTDETARALYDAQVGAIEPKEEIRARHILLKTREDADDVVERVNRGEDFAELAKEVSTGPSATQGGDLGYFVDGQMVKPFQDAAFALKTGEVSEPVETQFGWHVIKLEDRRDRSLPPFESLKDRILGSLIQRKAEEVMGALRSDAKIDVLDEDLRKALESAARGSGQ